MNKVFVNYSLIAAITVVAVLMSCKHNPDDDDIVITDNECIITLTTNQFTEIEFSMTGETKCQIDWGDGSEIEERSFSSLWEDHFQHRYLLDQSHTITITCKDVMSLTFSGNAFIGLDVSKDTVLKSLTFFDTEIANLDVSKNTALIVLDCNNNHRLTGLDLRNNTALQELRCAYNRQFTELDVSNNVKLTVLNCFDNELDELDVTNCTALKYLDCSFNRLHKLDVSKNVNLQQLHCHSNQLSQLDVSQNVKLNFLICGNNQLTQLDMSNNTALENLDCSYNRLDVAALSALFESLPGNNIQKYINIYNNPGTMQCRRSIAENKGWRVYDGSGVVVP